MKVHTFSVTIYQEPSNKEMLGRESLFSGFLFDPEDGEAKSITQTIPHYKASGVLFDLAKQVEEMEESMGMDGV